MINRATRRQEIKAILHERFAKLDVKIPRKERRAAFHRILAEQTRESPENNLDA